MDKKRKPPGANSGQEDTDGEVTYKNDRSEVIVLQEEKIRGNVVHHKKNRGDDLFLLKDCPTVQPITSLKRKRNVNPEAPSLGQFMLSVIHTIYKNTGFEMLNYIHSCGDNVLENIILKDVACTPEGWVEIAEECSNSSYWFLSDTIMSILKSHYGVVEIPSKNEDGASVHVMPAVNSRGSITTNAAKNRLKS